MPIYVAYTSIIDWTFDMYGRHINVLIFSFFLKQKLGHQSRRKININKQ